LLDHAILLSEVSAEGHFDGVEHTPFSIGVLLNNSGEVKEQSEDVGSLSIHPRLLVSKQGIQVLVDERHQSYLGLSEWFLLTFAQDDALTGVD
jgi:hypothetical protein